MATLESNIQRRVWIQASKNGITSWRNNVAKAWQGKRVDISGATVLLPSGKSFYVPRGIALLEHRPIDAGLCVGSSDLIGLRTLLVGPEHVGRKIAQFVALEVKTKTGTVRKEQKRFLAFIENAGGIGRIVRSPEDVPAQPQT